jgi:hypothetical protein
MNKVAVVLLTWKRIPDLKHTLGNLDKQTFKEFDVYISNGNLDPNKIATIEKYAKFFVNLNIKIINSGNDLYTFRRLVLGKELAEKGYEIILYIDDDVSFSEKYIAVCLEQYEPKTYKSGYAWHFFNGGKSYYKGRERRTDNKKPIHYCGTSLSMIDSSIFLEHGLFDYPEGALKIEDLWLSYYAQHVLGWSLMYMNTDRAVVHGRDEVALFREVRKENINKDEFLKRLVGMGWEIPSRFSH